MDHFARLLTVKVISKLSFYIYYHMTMNSTYSNIKLFSAHSEDQIKTINETDVSMLIISKITEDHLMCILMSRIRVHIGDRKRNSLIMKMDVQMDMNVINVMDGRN